MQNGQRGGCAYRREVSPNDETGREFAITAFSYRSNRAATRAYERLVKVFCARPDSGDSLYRAASKGTAIIAVVSWEPTAQAMRAIASLPWGNGQSFVLPPHVCQALARRSVEARPHRPNTVRRIFRDPAGHVIRQQDLPDRPDAA
jgi:hypothetical protein